MAKIIKNIQVAWSWSGDTYALKGFNLMVLPSGQTPTSGSINAVASARISPENRSYSFNNTTLDTGVTYVAWVQAFYEDGDSQWTNNASFSVADDGLNTLPTKGEATSIATTKADSALSSAQTYASTQATTALNSAKSYTTTVVGNTRTNGLGIKVDYSSFTTANAGEIYVHGYNTEGVATDSDGWVMWNGAKVTVTKGMINPNSVLPFNIPIYFLWSTVSSSILLAFYDTTAKKWKYSTMSPTAIGGDMNWVDGHIVLGQFVMTTSETLTGAVLYQTPKHYSEIVISSEATTYATTQATSALDGAKAYADAQLALEEARANAYADGIVTEEEAARLSALSTNLNEAKAYAESQANSAKTTAISTAATDATNKANTALSSAQSYALNEAKSINFGYRYATDIVVYGDSDKYYPVIIKGGDQNVKRDILIKRGYSEQAPSDWNTSTHKGGLTLKIKTNFGGWGGANYSWEIHELEEMYSRMFAGAQNTGNQTMFAIFLRGGGTTGAKYHLYSDQDLTANPSGYNMIGTIPPSPQIALNQDLIFYNVQGETIYQVNAPAYRTITQAVEDEIKQRKFIKLAQDTYSTVNTNQTVWGRASNINADGTISTTKLSGTVTDGQIASSSTWNTAKNNVLDMMSDSKVTPLEKQSLKIEYDAIKKEKAQADSVATTYSLTGNATYTTYVSHYNTLIAYLDTILANMTTTSSITRTTMEANMSNYYDYASRLSGLFNSTAKSIADTASSTANTASSNATTAVNTANSATTTANTANTNASNAVTTANTASTNATSAVNTANTASTNAANAVSTANTAASNASSALSTANTANTAVADMSNDNKLTPIEKQDTQKEWDVIKGEYSGILAEGTRFAVATATFTTEYNALDTYITPLLTNLTTTSDITGTTFRAKFKAYYDARQVLLNAVSAKAKTIADGAVSTANTASSNASSAVSTANTASSTASTASTNATTAVNTANSAASSASTALSTANTASSTASTASSNATTAVNTANSAVSTANTATTTANTAKSSIDNLTIGSTNIVRKSAIAPNSVASSSYDAATNTWTLTAANGAGGSWGAGLRITGSTVIVPLKSWYTLSFEIWTPVDINWNTDVNNYAVAGVTAWTAGNDNDNGGLRSTSTKALKANTWTKCWSTYSNSHAGATGDIYDGSNFGIVNNTGSDVTFKIRNVQGELGNRPTDWSISPYDLEQAYIDVALAKAALAETQARAYADGVVDAEETARIAEASAKLTEAKNYAASQASTAQSTAISTAASDATSKANTAQSTAISTAASDATTKANSAQTTAINTAKTYTDNLETLKIPDTRSDNRLPSWYRTNYPQKIINEFKGNGAMGVGSASYGSLTTVIQWANTSGGIITQTYENNGVKYFRSGSSDDTAWGAWSTVETTAGAQAKATAAETLAKTYADGVAAAKAALAETTAKAYADGVVDAEETARINEAKANLKLSVEAGTLNRNPIFTEWGGTHANYPSYMSYWSTASFGIKETAITKNGGFGLRFKNTGATQCGATMNGYFKPNLAPVKYVMIEVDFYLVSGSPASAGVLLDWQGMSTYRRQYQLSEMVPETIVTGKWYTAKKIFKRPSDTTTGFTGLGGYLMASYSSLATAVEKDIIYDRFVAREATQEEIDLFEKQGSWDAAGTNASAAVSTANTAASNASTAVSTANSASSTASTALSTANTASSTASTASTNASSAVSTANSAASAASTASSTASTALNTANTAKSTVDNMEIGGRNLVIRNGELVNKLIDTSGNVNSGTGSAVMDSYISVNAGETYTFTKDNADYWRWKWLDGSYAYISRTANNSNSFQWIVPSGASFIQVSYPISSKVKIEKGNKATSWTPSIEDVEASYTAVALAKAALAETQAKAYADGQVSAEESARISEASAKLTEAKNYAASQASSAQSAAISSAATDATSKANTAQTAAVFAARLETYKKTHLAVRYIRDWSNGSTANADNHWIEIKAMQGETNVALNKTVSTNGGTQNLTRVTDGDMSSAWAGGGSGLKYVQVDLGQIYYDIDSVLVARYYPDGRTYHETKTEVSSDGANWYPVFDSLIQGEYAETSAGKSFAPTIAKSESLLSAKLAREQALAYADGVVDAEEAARISAITTSLNSAKSYADTQIAPVATNASSALSTASTASSNASAAVSTANSASSAASTAVSTANSASSTASTAASNASTAVSTANSAASSASSAVSTANGAVSTANTASSTANTAKNTVDNMEIGGRNLWIQSDSVDGYTSGTGTIIGSTTNHKSMQSLTPAAAGKKIIYQVWNPNKITSGNSNRICYFNSSGVYLSQSTIPTLNGTDYQKAEFTTPANTASVRFAAIQGVASFDSSIKIKFELGTKATDWTPSPEDVDSFVNTKADGSTTRDSLDGLSTQVGDALAGLNDKADLSAFNQWVSNVTALDEYAKTVKKGLDAGLIDIENIKRFMTFDIGDMQLYYNAINQYMSYSEANGLLLGAKNDSVKLRFKNNIIEFVDGTTQVAYIDNMKMKITQADFTNGLEVGNHKIERLVGSEEFTVFTWVGSN